MASDNSDFVNWFRSSSPYIHAHRGRTFVLMIPGEAVDDRHFRRLAHDIALLNSLGIRLILVPGAGPQIDERLAQAGIAARHHHDLRITDTQTMNVVKDAVGHVRVEIEALLSQGLINTPMSGARVRVASGNYVTARPIGVVDGVDFRHTGHVRRIDTDSISARLDCGEIVLLPPLGYSATGEVFNLEAEEVAQQVAVRIGADKLILLTEENPAADHDRQAAVHLSVSEARRLLTDDGTLSTTNRRRLESAIDSCSDGVQRAHLVDYTQDGALLVELFTRDGCGLLINTNHYESVRTASGSDVGGIIELLRPYEKNGVLVKRSRELLETEIEYFTVIERDGMIIGCAALYPYPEQRHGELACLTVHRDYQHQGHGQRLIQLMEDKACRLGLDHVFVLTTQSAHWFIEHGYQESSLSSLPLEKQKLYNFQRNSKVFIKRLEACVSTSKKLKY